jgi:hypothetical protein
VDGKTPDPARLEPLEVEARKSQADGNGMETPMSLSDYIEIGVFSGTKHDEKVLSMRRERMTQEHATYEFVVDASPSRAGIDPYNKLIDRIPDDNTIDIASR